MFFSAKVNRYQKKDNKGKRFGMELFEKFERKHAENSAYNIRLIFNVL